MSHQEENSQKEAKEKPRRPLFGFILFSVIEEAIIGIIAFVIIIVFIPLYLVPASIVVVIGLGIFTAVKIYFFTKSTEIPVEDPIIGKEALALDDFNQRSEATWEGQVRLRGEIWQARAGTPIHRNAILIVISLEGLLLRVKEKSE